MKRAHACFVALVLFLLVVPGASAQDPIDMIRVNLLEVEPGAELPAECPTYLLEPAAWRLDGKSLERRRSADSVVRLAPGQTLRTRIDLSSHIDALLKDDPRDFRLQFDDFEQIVSGGNQDLMLVRRDDGTR